MNKKIAIIGCGDLGCRLAARLLEHGCHVTGARRNTDQLPVALGRMALDVTDPSTFDAFKAVEWDAIIVSLTARGEDAYWRVYRDGMKNILGALSDTKKRPALFFVSSTSVYHQNDGSIVDEDSATAPTGYSGRVMLATESLLQASGFPHASIRFSGIYGELPSRENPVSDTEREAKPSVGLLPGTRGAHLLSVLKEGRIAPKAPIRYSNRVHIRDCVAILEFLLMRFFAGKTLHPIYLGSDGNPAALHDVMCWLSKKQGIDPEALTADYLPNRGGNKRCCGKRLEEHGFEYQFKDYRMGYSAQGG